MRNIHTKSLLSLAIISALGAHSAPLYAQEAADDTEVIEVKGFRASMLKARDLKREAIGSQDSIVAEDIADFPDLNLADSLQRVPGISITREGGEGRQISLRGLGPSFTRVQLNGMEVLSTSSSAMDSRGAIGRSRSFDFNIFASELFNQIDVYKSFSAELDEGGIGGTVGLRTAKPFDFDGLKGAVSVNGAYNTNSEETNPRVAAMVSNTWDNFGALVSVAYSERSTSEVGVDTFRWRKRTRSADQYSDALPQDIKDNLEEGNIWFARGNRYSDWTNEQERLGLTAAFQFRPSDVLSFDLDILYGELNNARTEYHLDTAGSSSTALGFVEDLTVVDNNGDLEAVKGTFRDVTIRTETRRDQADTTFENISLTGKWFASENLTVRGLVGYSKSDFDQPELDKVYFQTTGGITTDYTQDRFYGVMTYDFDPADINNWRVRELDLREEYISSEFNTAKLDFTYTLESGNDIDFGVSLKQFENTGLRLDANDLVKDIGAPAFGPNQGDAPTDIPQGGYTIFEHPNQNWVAADVGAMQAYYGVLGWDLRDPAVRSFYDSSNKPSEFNSRLSNRFNIEEDTLAAYAQYNFEMDVGDGTLRGNIGARYYSTDITSSGLTTDDEQSRFSVEQDYSGVLPTFNLAWDLSDEIVLRFSANKNLTRPSINSLSVSAPTVQNDPDGSAGLRVSAGNPALEPFESVNIDTSFEYYMDEVGMVAVGIFHKDIDNFIVPETIEVPYGQLGLPLDLLGPGQTADTIYQYATTVNGRSATIKGVEIAFQRDLDFLPEPFNNLGVVANYTYADGETLYENVQGSGEDQVKSFPGLSKNSYNFTLYYETDKWGARVAMANRGEYISRVESGLGDEDERGFHETTYVDFSAFYQVNDDLKITLEGINLTDEREEQYSDSNDRPYNTTTSGRTYMLGLNYQF